MLKIAQYTESIANLVGLAQEAEQNKNSLQAKKYFQRALELAQPFELVQQYFDFLQRSQDFAEARQLLADFEQEFLRNGQLTDYWQKLWLIADYVVLDQSYQRLQYQHYQFSAAEKKQWQSLQQQLATVVIEPDKIAQLTANLLQAATTKTGGNAAVVLAKMQSLTPDAYVQVAQPTLASPALNPEVRVKLLDEISLFSATYSLTLNWRGEVRLLTTDQLTPLQYVPELEQFAVDFAQAQFNQTADTVDQQLAMSNLLTYILLTYPFCEQELQPHEIWRQFLSKGQIPATANAKEIKELSYWQEQERNLLNNLNA